MIKKQEPRTINTKLTGFQYIMRLLQLIYFTTDVCLTAVNISIFFNDDDHRIYGIGMLISVSIQMGVSSMNSLCYCISQFNSIVHDEINPQFAWIFEIFQFFGIEPILILLYNLFKCKYGILIEDQLSSAIGGLRIHILYQSIPISMMMAHFYLNSNFDQVKYMTVAIQLMASILNTIFGFLLFNKFKHAISQLRDFIGQAFHGQRIILVVGEAVLRIFFLALTSLINDSMNNNNEIYFKIFGLSLTLTLVILQIVFIIVLISIRYFVLRYIKKQNQSKLQEDYVFYTSYTILVGSLIIHPWCDSKTWQSVMEKQPWFRQDIALIGSISLSMIPTSFRLIQYTNLIGIYGSVGLHRMINFQMKEFIISILFLNICYYVCLWVFLISMVIYHLRSHAQIGIAPIKNVENQTTEKQSIGFYDPKINSKQRVKETQKFIELNTERNQKNENDIHIQFKPKPNGALDRFVARAEKIKSKTTFKKSRFADDPVTDEK